jgi:hypothetical protein
LTKARRACLYASSASRATACVDPGGLPIAPEQRDAGRHGRKHSRAESVRVRL